MSCVLSRAYTVSIADETDLEYMIMENKRDYMNSNNNFTRHFDMDPDTGKCDTVFERPRYYALPKQAVCPISPPTRYRHSSSTRPRLPSPPAPTRRISGHTSRPISPCIPRKSSGDYFSSPTSPDIVPLFGSRPSSPGIVPLFGSRPTSPDQVPYEKCDPLDRRHYQNADKHNKPGTDIV